MHRRLAAVVTLSVTLLVGACTDKAPQPPPPPSGGPSAEPSSSTSSSPTPSPSSSMNQADSDKAAVKTAYRDSFEEFNRLAMAGGATKLTRVLLDTTSGQHRQHYLKFLRDAKKKGIRQTKPAKLVGVSVDGGTSFTMHLTACEDYSNTSWVRRDGSKLPVKQPIRYLQRATATKGSDKRWRISFVETTNVNSFKGRSCGDG